MVHAHMIVIQMNQISIIIVYDQKEDMSDTLKTKSNSKELNATLVSPKHFQEMLDEHHISALECYFLREDYKYETKKFKFNYTLSQNGWDFIRNDEKLRLTAYDIKDGKITIGWGHAEPKKTSKYKVGDTITKSVAQKLLKKDLTKAADGVRRIFKQWEDKGIDVEITQNQFDALVSIAFNMGVSGLRMSQLIQDIKKGNLETAAETIKSEGTSDKFPGLVSRRMRESELFSS